HAPPREVERHRVARRVEVSFRTAVFKGRIPVSMDRRAFLTTSSLALAGAALARVPLLAQAGQNPPTTTFTDIRRNVGIFTGQGGTIGWLATSDGAVAVDAQFPATAKACVEGLQK